MPIIESHEAVIRQFLSENPQHIPGVRYRPNPERGGELDLVMDTDTMIAFTDWTIITGRGDTAKATRFREYLRKQFEK